MRRFAVAALLGLAAFASAGGDRHVGVASCAGGTCHAATRPFPDAIVRQDEYFTWQRKDRHAQAYNTLLSERSAQVARALGLGPAQDAPACLACHAETTPERGDKFQVSDGIGCEACHGAAERWLGPHVRGFASAQERRDHGMYATESAPARAALCLSCHQGDAGHPMTHAIMAAGHPQLLFELDTFQALEPAHHAVDADYVKRKGAQDPFRNWLAGQLQAVRQLLDGIASPRFNRGLVPELAFFDCAACHHSMQGMRARANRSAGLAAGDVPFADASFEMIDAWLQETAPTQARRWREQWSALHRARGSGAAAVQKQARAMQIFVTTNLAEHLGDEYDAAQVNRVLRRIVGDAREPRSGDFAYAQQTAMASLVMIGALHARGQEAPVAARVAVDKVYAAVRDADRFSVREWRDAIDALGRALGRS
jgi:hypothetical protein